MFGLNITSARLIKTCCSYRFYSVFWYHLNSPPLQIVLMFETDDLVLRKNEKNFVLCLLEVARRASRSAWLHQSSFSWSREIEEEIRERWRTCLLQPKPQRSLRNIQNLDEMVMHHRFKLT